MKVFKAQANALSDHYNTLLTEEEPTRRLELMIPTHSHPEAMVDLGLQTTLDHFVMLMPQANKKEFMSTVLKTLTSGHIRPPFSILLL